MQLDISFRSSRKFSTLSPRFKTKVQNRNSALLSNFSNHSTNSNELSGMIDAYNTFFTTKIDPAKRPVANCKLRLHNYMMK